MPRSTAELADKRSEALPALYHKYRFPISQALRESVDGRPLPVYDVLRYSMGWSDFDGNPRTATEGKTLRPTLCLFACEAVGGLPQNALPAAVALELIHHFSLIHDDIQDRDEMRHHRPTVWALWGDARAVVGGNTLRVVADTCLSRLVDHGLSTDEALLVTGLLTDASLEMIEGQWLDLVYESRSVVSLADYMSMIARKTGALISCSLQIGATIGGADPSTAAAFRECGQHLGRAFQIKDDLLGVWGDEEATGKPVGADIKRRKKSFPVVYAMSQARGDDRSDLMELYKQERLSDVDTAIALEIMERVGASEHAAELAAGHTDLAIQALSAVELSLSARTELAEMARFLLDREH